MLTSWLLRRQPSLSSSSLRRRRSSFRPCLERLEERVQPSINPNAIPTVGVYDENVIQPNTVDFVAPGSSVTNTQFAANIAAAYQQDLGGVIDGSVLGAYYSYGVNHSKMLTVLPTNGTNWGIGLGPTISGTGSFATTSQGGYNFLSLSFAGIDSGLPNEHVVSFGVTAMSLTNRDYGNVTVTGQLASGGTLTASRHINDPAGAGDTFYGFTAPANDYFTSFSLRYDGAVVPDVRLWFDDIGFITAVVGGGNVPPVAVNDSYTVNEDNTLTVGAPGVLANDTDANGDTLHAALVSGPVHGTVTLNADGSFSYTPAANFNGSDSFTYKANDGLADSNVAIVTVRVNPVNDAPVAADDAYSTHRGVPLTVASPGVLANDSDVDGPTLTAVLYSNPAHGSLTFFSSGSFTYTPVAGYVGTDSFTYRDSDGSLLSNLATVTLTVEDINDAPVAGNDSYTTTQNTPLNVAAPGVLGNDADPNQDALSAVLVTGPAHGSLVLNGDGSFSYTPAAGYGGSDSFTYQASDGSLLSNVATVSIRVNGAPVAGNDAYTTAEDTSLNVAAPGVLSNDSDPNGDALTAVLVSGPTHGTLTLNSNGSIAYTPFSNFNGTDSFTYRASDGSLLSNVATVTITVTPVNDPPSSFQDSYTTTEDTPLAVASPGVLGNDSDPDGDPLTAILVSGPANGTLSFNANGSFNYTPNANFSGQDRFTYKASDGSLTSAVTSVLITVQAVNDAPVASDDSYSLDENQSLTITAPVPVTSLNMVSQPGDWIGQGKTYNLTPADGTFTVQRNFDNGVEVRYASFANSLDDYWDLNFAAPYRAIPTPGSYPGATRWPFQDLASPGLDVSGQHRGSNTLTGQFTIKQALFGPAGEVLRFDATFEQHSEGQPPALTGEVQYDATSGQAGVLANDTDADSNLLSAVLVSGPTHGTLTLNTDGTFTYTPFANFHGTDSFTYRASDGNLTSNLATVTLTVRPVELGPPVSADDSYSTNEDTPLNVGVPGVLANDTDPDNDPLTAALVSGPAHGSLTLNNNGSFVYTPAANFNGTDAFTYKANDGTSDGNTATVTITVVPVNDPPVAVAGPDQTANEGAPVAFDGSGSSDVDGDPLTYAWNFGDGKTASGAQVTHAYADNGTYTVTLTVSDGHGGTDTDTLTVTVKNLPPKVILSVPAGGVRGETRTFIDTDDDPSTTDQAKGFAFQVRWGDGQVETFTGSSPQTLSHVYTDSGNFTMQVFATDKDGGTGTATGTIVITDAELQGDTLAVSGTTGADTITIGPADANGTLSVTVNGGPARLFGPVSRIVVFGQAGNDTIRLTHNGPGQSKKGFINVPAVLVGGDGNDTLDASGSRANNILIGGSGADSLSGGAGDDVLIGEATAFDNNLTALDALMAEWARTDADYATRVAHLSGSPGGLNGTYFLNSSTVIDDSAADVLVGDGGQDWFVNGASGLNPDQVQGKKRFEIATSL